MIIPVQLGKPYTDTITGFAGTAIGRCEYLDGRITVGLERGDSTCKPETTWFDEVRLEPTDNSKATGFR